MEHKKHKGPYRLRTSMGVGLNPVQEISGASVTANLLTGLGIDEYYARTTTAGTRTFLTDGLRSTLSLTDDAGALQNEYPYEPFGATTETGADSNPFQYTGRENDGTGLYYYRARYYHPGLHRFVSEDPKGFAGGMHFYVYVGNSPLNFTDSFGPDKDPSTPDSPPGCKPVNLRARVTWYRWNGFRTASGALPHLGTGSLNDPTTVAVPGTRLIWQGPGTRLGRPLPGRPLYYGFGTMIYIQGYGWTIVQDACPECTPGHPQYNVPLGADIRIDVYGIGEDLGVRDIMVCPK